MGEILNSVRAQVLVDALPYIQKYNNKILVVKYGGNAMTNNELKQAVMDDIVLLSLVGVKVVLVHGGGNAGHLLLLAADGGNEPGFHAFPVYDAAHVF